MDKIEILNKYPFYCEAGRAIQKEFEDVAVCASLNSGDFYFHEGDICSQIALIGKGSIRVYKSGETGREITLYHVRSGEACILTASCVLAEEPYPATAEIEYQVKAVVFPAAIFRDWISRIGPVRDFVFKTLAKRVAGVMALVEEITFNKMDHRLAEFLLHRFSNKCRPNNVLELTHEQIAAELGSAREVISRLLKEFERLGAINLTRGRIHLIDGKMLNKHVNFV
jgi:CRP/FNR family transcriptional regulator